MDPRYYCHVCEIFCGDAPGILLHMISVEHQQAYLSHLRQRQRAENLTKVQECGGNIRTNHPIASSTRGKDLEDSALKLSQLSLNGKSGNPRKSKLLYKGTEDDLQTHEEKIFSLFRKNFLAAHKNNDIILQVIVTGFSCSPETVRENFSVFGYILTFQVIGGIISITYLYMPMIEKFLLEAENNHIIINGMDFDISIQVLKPLNGHDVSEIPHFMESMLTSGKDFENRMKELMLETELDSVEREKEKQAVLSIVQCLDYKYHPIVYPFGSRLTGLGNKESDLDIHLKITAPLKLANKFKATSDIKKKVSEKLVYSVGEHLKADKDFSDIVKIPKASTAIVKCVHKPTGICCDLSFQAPYGVFRTSLIAFYLSLDYRVKPLLVFIRFWGKIHGISGKNKFHSYALTLMAIFYLQRISILPSAATLINSAKESERNIIDFWECGVSHDASLLPRVENTSSFLEVLRGFFQFYSSFDFRRYVISPYLGVTIERHLFVLGLEYEYPSLFTQYLLNIKNNGEGPLNVTGEVCVQDFFVHNCNVAGSLHCWEILHNFLAFCNMYVQVIDSIFEKFMHSSNCDVMLQKIFQNTVMKNDFNVSNFPGNATKMEQNDPKSQ